MFDQPFEIPDPFATVEALLADGAAGDRADEDTDPMVARDRVHQDEEPIMTSPSPESRPRRVRHDEHPAPLEDEAVRPARGPAHVLLAEDDEACRSLVAHALESAGYRVTICPDGVELADHVGAFVLSGAGADFDLILSDIRMPGVSGLQVLEGMSRWAGFPPMILMTAFGDEATHAAAERLGAAAMLDKPFELDTLLAIVRELVARRRRPAHEGPA